MLETDNANFEKHKSSSVTLYERNKDGKRVVLSDFKIIKLVGRSYHSCVFLAERKDSKEVYALKQKNKDEFFSSDNGDFNFKSFEQSILQNFNSPFLINIEFVFQSNQNIYFASKFYNGADLFTYLSNNKRLPETRIRFYAAQIALAIENLHSKKIIYQCLKLYHIMIDS